jgi:nicotinamidase-related amidase
MDGTIVDEWDAVEIPQPPQLEEVAADPGKTALLILDIQRQNCNQERRPRCVSSLPGTRRLLERARERGALVVYSLTSSAEESDIREEVAPRGGEPIVKSGVDKFFNTELEQILRDGGVDAVIIAGTSAHGAVLHTATGAALRKYRVIIPVDCVSAGEAYAEQYTAWHLINAPGSRRQAVLTRSDLIRM